MSAKGISSNEIGFSKCIEEGVVAWLTERGPKAYHLVASFWNWDQGMAVLDWIISQPDCDAGTAQIIFWRTEPFYYSEESRNADGGFGVNDEGYRLALKIAGKWSAGFYQTWQFSEASGAYADVQPVRGSRQVNDELVIPDGLDEPRPGLDPDDLDSYVLEPQFEALDEGVPESVREACNGEDD